MKAFIIDKEEKARGKDKKGKKSPAKPPRPRQTSIRLGRGGKKEKVVEVVITDEVKRDTEIAQRMEKIELKVK